MTKTTFSSWALGGGAAALLALATACAGGPDEPATGADARPSPYGGTVVTFAQVHRDVIQVRCLQCHREDADSPSGSHYLRLVDVDVAYDALVGTPSPSPPGEVRACAGEMRVISGDPETSLLWRKVAIGVPVCGFKMPPSCHGNDCGLPERDAALVYDWIATGALR